MKVRPTLKVSVPDVLKAKFLVTKFAHLMDLGRKASSFKMDLLILRYFYSAIVIVENSKGKIQIHT